MIEIIRLEDGQTQTVIICDSGCNAGGSIQPKFLRKVSVDWHANYQVIPANSTPEQLGWVERDWGWQCPECTKEEQRLETLEGVIRSGATYGTVPPPLPYPESEEE